MTREDEIMARYLLKGGKMLSASCPTCGCPLFEVAGKRLCVVCQESKAGEGAPVTGWEGDTGDSPPEKGPVPAEAGVLGCALERALVLLCERIGQEEDPSRVKILVDAVAVGVETLAKIPQVYDKR
ncbi:MAG: autoantigen p27 domain-containing protein [Methanolinea sp.]|nr:autoantigen p27 domain-containing protein [Methanolinea sp.]